MPTKPEPPIATSPTTHTSDRRAASPKQASSVTSSKWPLVGSATYTKLATAGLKGAEGAELGPKLLRLSHARCALYTTMLAVDGAINQVNPQVKGKTPDAAVYNKLRSIRAELEGVWKEFPLEVR